MIRHLVLLGMGPGHLLLLKALLKKRPADVAISLISRQKRYVGDAHLLQSVATRVAMDNCGVLLEPLLRAATVRQLHHHVKAVDPAAKVLLLDDGRELRFDWLSLEPEPAQRRDALEAALPGARANGLFIRPREAFCALWPRVAELAAARPLSLAVICGSPPAKAPTPAESKPVAWADEKFAIELAFAVRRACGGSAVTLITGGQPVADGRHPALQSCLQTALKQRRITVLVDAASGIQSGEVVLRSGARLSCDVPLLALDAAPPTWLADSGLALDAQGQVAVDAANRSTSHPHVHAHGSWPASKSMPSARQLAANLCAVMDQKPPPQGRPARKPQALAPAQWLDTADGRAVLGWRGWAWQSWVAGAALRWLHQS